MDGSLILTLLLPPSTSSVKFMESMATADGSLCALSPLRCSPLAVRLSHHWWLEKPLTVSVPLVLHLCPYMALKYLF